MHYNHLPKEFDSSRADVPTCTAVTGDKWTFQIIRMRQQQKRQRFNCSHENRSISLRSVALATITRHPIVLASISSGNSLSALLLLLLVLASFLLSKTFPNQFYFSTLTTLMLLCLHSYSVSFIQLKEYQYELFSHLATGVHHPINATLSTPMPSNCTVMRTSPDASAQYVASEQNSVNLEGKRGKIKLTQETVVYHLDKKGHFSRKQCKNHISIRTR